MIGRLESSFAALRRFTADASHELKTPLTVLRADLERAMSAPAKGTEQLVALEEALNETARMADLVDSLLTLARADEGRFDLHREPVELEALVHDVGETAHILCEMAGLTSRITASLPVTVNGDRERLRQLFLNLITNAVKYTAKGGSVELALERKDDQIHFSVKDTGLGIAGADLPFIFDRFWRVDRARSRSERGGVGLGLAISLWIAQAHGGSISVASRMGKGSTFTVILPVLEPVATQDEGKSALHRFVIEPHGESQSGGRSMRERHHPPAPGGPVFRTLLASAPERDRRTPQALASLSLHTAGIAAALWLTQRGLPAAAPNAPPVYVRYQQPETITHVATAAASAVQQAATAAQAVVPSITIPMTVPVGLPVIDLGAAFDAGKALAWSAPATGTLPGATTSGPAGTGPRQAFEVDTPVAALAGQPQPRYPELLRTTAVEGRVTVRFVVDTTGRVERGSIEVVESTHALFAEAVRAVLLRQRFLPAEAGGRRVRQLVLQPFEFRLNR
jgi:TonB family protein